QHPADTASETFEREKDVSILEQLEEELAELQAALERIDQGTYGIDEVTGEPIAPERLTAFPTARTNVDTEAPRERDDRPRPTGAGDPEASCCSSRSTRSGSGTTSRSSRSMPSGSSSTPPRRTTRSPRTPTASSRRRCSRSSPSGTSWAAPWARSRRPRRSR